MNVYIKIYSKMEYQLTLSKRLVLSIFHQRLTSCQLQDLQL